MPRASSPPGAGLRKVKRRKSSGYANPREQAMYGGSRKSRVVKATKVEKSLRTGRRTAAVEAYKSRGPGKISAKQEAIALRTLARRATSPSEWKRLQADSPTGYALPKLEQGVTKPPRTSSPKIGVATVGRGGGYVPAQSQSKDKMSVGEAWGWLTKELAGVDLPDPVVKANKALTKIMPAGEAIYQAQKLAGLDKRVSVAPIDLIPVGGVAARQGRYALRAGGRLLKRGGKTVEIGAREADKLSKSGARVVEPPKVKPAPKAKPAPKPKPEPTGVKRPLAKVEDATMKAKAAGREKFKALPKPAQAGAKAVTWPVRGRGKFLKVAAVGTGANVAGQVPAAISTGDASKLTAPLTDPTAGVLNPVVGQIASVAPGQVAENFISDLFELPIAIVPSIFLTGKAVVQAGQGDSEMLDAMVKDYVENGFLPNVIEGDVQGARRAFEEHPLYAALTVRGVYAGVGRSAGAAARSGALGKKLKKAGSTKRADLKVGAGQVEEQRYSPNIFTKSVQQAIEKNKAKRGLDPNNVLNRRGGASKQQRLQQKAAVHELTGQEGARRMNREEAAKMTDKRGKERKFDRLVPRSLRDVTTLFIQGEVRRADTWRKDLTAARDRYRAAAAKARADGSWTGAQFRRNAGLIRDINIALKRSNDADAARMIELRDQFVAKQDPVMGDIIERGVFTTEQFRTARARPFAVAHMGAKWDAKFNNGPGKQPGALVDAQGRKLNLASIEKRMAAEGVTPGFVSQKPGMRGAKGVFYQPLSFIAGRRGNVGNKKRTGRASEQGTFDATVEAAVEQLTASRTLADRLQGFDRVLNEFVVRDGSTGKPRYFKNFNEARMAADDPESFGLPTDTPLTPVRITPIGSKTGERDAAIRFLDNTNRIGDDTRSLERLDQDAINRLTQDGKGEVVLVPRTIFDTVESMARPQNTMTRIMSSLSSAFKGVILPVSPRWLIGNAIDPAIRSALAGLTPVDWLAGRQILTELRKMDPDAAKRIDSELTGGTQYGAADRLRIKRSQPNQWGDSTWASDGLGLWIKFRNAPVIRNLSDVYAHYRDGMFRWNSEIFERQPQIAALGREGRRRINDVNGNWRNSLGLGGKAYEDLARGLLDSKAQRAYANSIERVFGSWNRLSRLEKDALATYVPFGLWLRAAYQYVAITLPVYHPIKVAIGVQLAQMTEEERQRLGLSLTVDKRLPDNLQGSIPISDTLFLQPQAFTSFGMFSGAPEQVSRVLLPQLAGAQEGLKGLDWLNNELVSRDGKALTQEQKFALAAINMAEVTFPTLGLGFRLATGRNLDELVAVPPYKRTKDPAKDRLISWGGLSTMNEQQIKDAIKWRQSYNIGVPGVPDIGQEEDKKKGGGGVVRVVP